MFGYNRYNMNKAKKPNVMVDLGNVINLKYNYKENHRGTAVLSELTRNNSHIQIKPEWVSKKEEISQYASQLLSKLSLHQRYCQQVFEGEISKYEDYYRQIKKYLECKQKEGRAIIEAEKLKIEAIFTRYKNQITYLQSHFGAIYKDHDLAANDIYQQIHKYTIIDVGIIRINFPQIESFHRDFQKYTLTSIDQKQLEETLSRSIQRTQKAAAVSPDLYQVDKSHEDEVKRDEETEPLSPESTSMDDLLGCDEQLGSKASANTIRRRKYDVGRQNVIKEEDEYDDTNSIVSDC